MTQSNTNRREFMEQGAKLAARSIFRFFEEFNDAGASPNHVSAQGKPITRAFLRPPGALSEPDFLKACTRCDECVRACPHMAIRKADHSYGEALRGTPIILPREKACRLCADLDCVKVCEPKALVLDARENARMGTAILDTNACYAHQGQPCDYCVTKCPLKRDAISFNEHRQPEIHEEGCTGCGVCVEWCPGDAIKIIEQ